MSLVPFDTNGQTAGNSALGAASASALTRAPLYFGPAERSLFGWYHAPAGVAPRKLAIVICPPLGNEYMSSHRSLRHLADRLATAGIPALRFDYHGTGDSMGSSEDPGRVAAWLDSIQEAVQTLRAASGCAHIGLIGLRMGATLAAIASQQIALSCLVLWAPCVRGRTYIRELKALHVAGDTPGMVLLESADLEAGGFVTTAETQRDIAPINLEETPPTARRVLLVARDDMAADTRVRDKWSATGLSIEQRVLPGYLRMFASPHDTIVPQTAIAEIVEWLVAAADSNTEASTGHRAEPRALAGGARQLVVGEIRESIVRFGPASTLFGILSEPLTGNSAAPTILLPNAGSTHHVGSNNLYVILARTLTRAGFRCLRFDFPGLGDSVIDNVDAENNPYVADASDVIDMAMQTVAPRAGAASFVIMGLCSGAHAAFHAGLELAERPIVECVLINPLTFYYKPGMSLEAPALQQYETWQRYMRALRNPRSWVKLLRKDTDFAGIFMTVFRRMLAVIGSKIKSRKSSNDTNSAVATDDLKADIGKLIKAGRKLTFVFSRFDPGYDLLMFGAAGAVKRFRRRGFIKLWRIDKTNHTFNTRAPRRQVVELLRDHLVGHYLRKR
ncbi:MAG: alpha/beta fold hydrolase [Gammaproteobacteria bacterium]|nr:alpha/beta fold hydrolase [Gammaproteobacteria bacterium]